MEPHWHEGRNALNPGALALELLPGGPVARKGTTVPHSTGLRPSSISLHKTKSWKFNWRHSSAQPQELLEAQRCLRAHPKASLPTATLPAPGAQLCNPSPRTPAPSVSHVTRVPQHILQTSSRPVLLPREAPGLGHQRVMPPL